MIRSRSFMTQEVRLISWKEATSLGDFPAFSDVMMTAVLQIHGQFARWNDALNMECSFWRAKERSDLRNVDGMSSGQAATLRSSSELLTMLMQEQLLLPTDGVLRIYLRWRLRSQSTFVMWSLLTLA